MAGAQLVAVEESPATLGRTVVVEYTDPYSVWCWGLEPAIRRFEVRYPGAVEVQVRMGGLFEDFGPMRGYWTRMSGGRWRESVETFVAAVEGQHRMPMDARGMVRAIDDFQSTWPACVAVKAAERQGVAAGRRYLRRLREGAVVDGLAIHRRAVQGDLAREAGLDGPAFAAALDDGTAERAFREDLAECKSLGISGFPTLEVRRGYVSVRVEGYRPWREVEEAVRGLEPGLAPRPLAATEGNVRDVLRRHARWATREIAAVFGITDDEADVLLDELAAKGVLARTEVGTGLLWRLAPTEVSRAKEAGP